ncbi:MULTISPECIES: phage holin, lambda family [unclassified Pseudomonas]|uniref:phage holin, lambda family n=1 Tax=unclassified Pseudomonas TaxID=196821 RepID=UPI00244A962A|nr:MULTISPECIES: phage holin, lambda family [unclassified Pseudomonas]MDH0894699.1 phage holin, lambda family [Pseudomonas sp. GD03875]MDH1067251.1 phage holin, lambda family [Pseudomonas sp. GD03985]
MPDRPETWAWLGAWLEHHHPLIYAAALSAVLATARFIHSGGGVRRALSEGFICGLITLAVSNGLALVGIPAGYAPFFGGFVGLVGSDAIRHGLKRLYNRKVDNL